MLTRPDRPRGRGRALEGSPVKRLAEARGLPLLQPETLRSAAALEPLSAWNPDVLVVVAYGLLLPPEVLALPRLGCLNIHASLLPRWRGAAPIARAVLAGDAVSGVSLMLMDAGLDTGPVLLQRSLALPPGVTTGALQERLAALGAGLLPAGLEALAQGSAQAQPQSEAGVTYAPKVHKSEAPIDWTRSAAEIDRQVRAFNPWPIAQTQLGGEPLRIHAGRPLERAPSGVPAGTVVALTGEGILVQCGEGVFAIGQLQRPGRRILAAGEFAHAGTLEQGQRLGAA